VTPPDFSKPAPPQRGPQPAVDYAIDGYWDRGWRGPSTVRVTAEKITVLPDAAKHAAAEGAVAPVRHLPGVLLPGFRDSHVHLGLIDPHTLIAGGLAAVDDLGGDPDKLIAWADDPTVPALRYAGSFITAPGGYPATREWAATLSVREVSTPEQAITVVAEQVAAGATLVKVTLNTDEGPVISDETLAAVVEYAHGRGCEVVAHVQGAGQAQRAFDRGVDRLAHTPWTERLDDGLIEAMAHTDQRFLGGRHSWISTLDIHGYGRYGNDFEIASDNLRRFHHAGGIVHYGTDLGNGDLPAGLNQRELVAMQNAGVRDDALLNALCLPRLSSTVSHLPTAPDADTDLAEWLMTATVVTARELMRTR